MIKALVSFINYWYFRYLLLTELYMVEKWERVMMHIVLFIIFSIISIFNTTVVVGLLSIVTQSFFENAGFRSNNLQSMDQQMHTEF